MLKQHIKTPAVLHKSMEIRLIHSGGPSETAVTQDIPSDSAYKCPYIICIRIKCLLCKKQ